MYDVLICTRAILDYYLEFFCCCFFFFGGGGGEGGESVSFCRQPSVLLPLCDNPDPLPESIDTNHSQPQTPVLYCGYGIHVDGNGNISFFFRSGSVAHSSALNLPPANTVVNATVDFDLQ